MLFAVADLVHPPAAGLVLGRLRDKTGSSNYLERVVISGPFYGACLYNCCHEGLVAVRCSFRNLSDHAAYFDSNEDVHGLTRLVTPSNVTKTFYGCSFLSKTSDSASSRIVTLHGNQSALRFKDCYFSFLGGQGAVFFMEDEAGQIRCTKRLTIEDGRVEQNEREDGTRLADLSNTRLIRYAKGAALSGLEIRGLDFKPRSQGDHAQPILIEVSRGGLVRSNIEILDCEDLSKAIVCGDVPLENNKVTVPAESMITASAHRTSKNIVFVMDGLNPWDGPGD
jgi:hypothetical protein